MKRALIFVLLVLTVPLEGVAPTEQIRTPLSPAFAESALNLLPIAIPCGVLTQGRIAGPQLYMEYMARWGANLTSFLPFHRNASEAPAEKIPHQSGPRMTRRLWLAMGGLLLVNGHSGSTPRDQQYLDWLNNQVLSSLVKFLASRPGWSKKAPVVAELKGTFQIKDDQPMENPIQIDFLFERQQNNQGNSEMSAPRFVTNISASYMQEIYRHRDELASTMLMESLLVKEAPAIEFIRNSGIALSDIDDLWAAIAAKTNGMPLGEGQNLSAFRQTPLAMAIQILTYFILNQEKVGYMDRIRFLRTQEWNSERMKQSAQALQFSSPTLFRAWQDAKKEADLYLPDRSLSYIRMEKHLEAAIRLARTSSSQTIQRQAWLFRLAKLVELAEGRIIYHNGQYIVPRNPTTRMPTNDYFAYLLRQQMPTKDFIQQVLARLGAPRAHSPAKRPAAALAMAA